MREDPESREQEKEIEKLPEAILCSGDRDSLNVAGFRLPGTLDEFRNSTIIRKFKYKSIMKCVETLYILPDIDTTRNPVGNPVRTTISGYPFYLVT